MSLKPQDEFAVRRATAEEFAVAIGWARDEGWNPGLGDLEAFLAADPSGFLMGFADGKPVSSISVVRYGDEQGFLGFYIVHPEVRGKGFGIATWNAGMAYLEKRTVGLDGVVAQQDNYTKSGFQLVGRNIRFTGVPGLAGLPGSAVKTEAARADHADQIEILDRVCFGVPRPDFLKAWIFAAPDVPVRFYRGFTKDVTITAKILVGCAHPLGGRVPRTGGRGSWRDEQRSSWPRSTSGMST
jgi:GNAT superfamily N-acetyltransferase